MMRRYAPTARRLILAITATFVASLGVAATAAQATVVQDNHGNTYGVALAPASGSLSGTGS